MTTSMKTMLSKEISKRIEFFLRIDEVSQVNAISGMGEKHYMDEIDEISQ